MGDGMGKKKTDLNRRLVIFAAKVVKMVGKFPKDLPGRRVGDQVLRSSTSVGANYAEAQGAQSRPDFLHKLQVSLKEMRESHYWLELVSEAEIADRKCMDPLVDEARQLVAILSKSVVTAKTRSRDQPPLNTTD